MNKFIAGGYLLLAFVVLFILYRTKSAVAKWAEDPIDNTLNSAPAQSVGDTLSNPVSRFFGSIFQSDAEKEVNALYKRDNVAKPSSGDYMNAPGSFQNQVATGIAAMNPAPGPQTTVGKITTPAVVRPTPNRAQGTIYSTGDPALNQNPPNNNATFAKPEPFYF